MNKKFCVVVIALIVLCMATGAVFAQYSPTSCPSHHTRWRDGCRDCRIAQNNIDKNRQAAAARAKQQRLNEQRKRLAQKEQEKAAAATAAEANQIEQEIKSIRMIIIQIEADLD